MTPLVFSGTPLGIGIGVEAESRGLEARHSQAQGEAAVRKTPWVQARPPSHAR